MGLFYPFLDDPVRLIGVEAAGEGLGTGLHSASLGEGRPGVLHGSLSMLLQNEDGQVSPAHSVSAGLDYPGVGPEHAHLSASGRAEYVSATDEEALEACVAISRTEGIIPALETAHAIAALGRLGKELGPGKIVVVCFSGRGDKDIPTMVDVLKLEERDG
jgi:tryptophan synthase beta chain